MCNCVDRINKEFKEIGLNAKLIVAVFPKESSLNKEMLVIATKKRNTRSKLKPTGIRGSYCPFCGEKYINDGWDKPT